LKPAQLKRRRKKCGVSRRSDLEWPVQRPELEEGKERKRCTVSYI
jgi:hypothetical protein